MMAINTAPFLGLPHATITLASASVTRQNILRAAGVDFNVAPTAIDETRVRADAQAGDMAADEIAVLLAFLNHLLHHLGIRQGLLVHQYVYLTFHPFVFLVFLVLLALLVLLLLLQVRH